MNNKIIALSNHLKLNDVSEIKELDTCLYKHNNEEYYVFTDDEADDEAKRLIHDIIIYNIGITKLNIDIKDFVDFVDIDWFDEVMIEDNKDYVDEIENEDSVKYENRLIEELHHFNIIHDGDFENHNGKLILKSIFNIEALKKEYLNELFLNGDNSIEWFISNFGRDEFNTVVIEEDLVDIDELVLYFIEVDGRGFISPYDEIEYLETISGENYYIYRIS